MGRGCGLKVRDDGCGVNEGGMRGNGGLGREEGSMMSFFLKWLLGYFGEMVSSKERFSYLEGVDNNAGLNSNVRSIYESGSR